MPRRDETLALGQRIGGARVEELVAGEDVEALKRLIVFSEDDIEHSTDESDRRDHAELRPKRRRDPAVAHDLDTPLTTGRIERRTVEPRLHPLERSLDCVVADHRDDQRRHQCHHHEHPEVRAVVVPEQRLALRAEQVGKRLP